MVVQPGQRYNRLLVVGQAESKDWATQWKCICDCGRLTIVKACNLNSGNTQSCGCLRRERLYEAASRPKTHGKYGTAEYAIWRNMIYRSRNPNAPNSRYYSEKGVTVCRRWLESFENFLADVALRPSPQHSLDRYPNPDGNYEPGNVRWATAKQQAQNRRGTILLTLNNETRPQAEWEDLYGLARGTITRRRNKGWSIGRWLEPTRVYEKRPHR